MFGVIKRAFEGGCSGFARWLPYCHGVSRWWWLLGGCMVVTTVIGVVARVFGLVCYNVRKWWLGVARVYEVV